MEQTDERMDDLRAEIKAEEEQAYREAMQAYDGEFAVTDAESADWVVARIAEAEAEQQRLADQFERAHAVLQRRKDFLRWRFEAELAAWARNNLPKGRKSVILPHGTLGFRTKRESVEVYDEAKALEWAVQHCPEAVKTTTRIVKTPLRDHVEQTGEEPPGCRLHPSEESFYVK